MPTSSPSTLYSREECFPFGENAFGGYGKKRYRFTGKERDDGSGLYYFGARYYAPWLCRFTSVDPLKAESPGMNPYQYADCNPMTNIDPTGMKTENGNNSKVSKAPPDQFKTNEAEASNLVLKGLDNIAAEVKAAAESVSDWVESLDFEMSGNIEVSAGPAYSVEVKALGAKAGLGEGTKYSVIQAGFALQTEGLNERNGYDNINGTRLNVSSSNILQSDNVKAENFKSTGLVIGGQTSISYNVDKETGKKSDIELSNEYNLAIIGIETSKGLSKFPEGGVSGIAELGVSPDKMGENSEFFGIEFEVDLMLIIGVEVSGKVGFTNNYVKENAGF